jgi:hypothetical protein
VVVALPVVAGARAVLRGPAGCGAGAGAGGMLGDGALFFERGMCGGVVVFGGGFGGGGMRVCWVGGVTLGGGLG